MLTTIPPKPLVSDSYFKIVVGICTGVIDILFEDMSLVSLLEIILLFIIDVSPVYYNRSLCNNPEEQRLLLH
jgi:ABC-type polysaccharide/polyol phosphate export permease